MSALPRGVGAGTKAATLSSESIASPSSAGNGAVPRCGGCDAPLAADQRYCLECGERRPQTSAFLFAGVPPGQAAGASPGPGAGRSAGPAGPPREPASPPLVPPAAGGAAYVGAQRGGNTATLIAGVGVLLLAMGVGVLIGRAGAGKPSAAPAQVITVAATGAGPSGAASESFSDDWPAGTNGYTVQLQTLAQAGTSVSAVDAAKAAASAKGAGGVGALKSEDFTSLPAGSYVIYAGVDHTRAEAQRALAGLKKRFPGARVVRVANGSASSSGHGAQPPGGSGGSGGSSLNHPAPSSVLESLKNTKGKSYEEKSKNLPDVVSTG